MSHTVWLIRYESLLSKHRKGIIKAMSPMDGTDIWMVSLYFIWIHRNNVTAKNTLIHSYQDRDLDGLDKTRPLNLDLWAKGAVKL